MRKGILIGLIAVMAIGVLAFLVSQPKRGTVEWHKREYKAAFEPGILDIEFLADRIPGAMQTAYWLRREKRIEIHRQALIEAGYFGEKVFIVTNRPPRKVAFAVWRTIHFEFLKTNDLAGIPIIRGIGSNSVRIVAQPKAYGKIGGIGAPGGCAGGSRVTRTTAEKNQFVPHPGLLPRGEGILRVPRVEPTASSRPWATIFLPLRGCRITPQA